MSTSSTDGDDSRDAADGLLEIGRIDRPHGLRGEVIVSLVSNLPERLSPGSGLVARRSGVADEVLVVESSSPHQGRSIVRFAGHDGREAAEALRGTLLLAEPLVDPGALFAHELIGCELVEVSGRSHGRVAALQENPASDLLVGEQGWLVPLRFVVSREKGRIVVEAPKGLFE